MIGDVKINVERKILTIGIRKLSQSVKYLTTSLKFDTMLQILTAQIRPGVDNNIVQYYHIEKLLKIIAIYRY